MVPSFDLDTDPSPSESEDEAPKYEKGEREKKQ